MGPSGRLLDTVLEHHDIDRRTAYVDNVVACRPPSNRTPSKIEIQSCWPRAKAEIQARAPSTILCLGNTATQAVLATRAGITTVRVGPPKTSPDFPGAAIVPTFHPAACLRSADSFPYLVTDVGKLKQPPSTWEPPKYKVFDDPAMAVKALEQIHRGYDVLVVDIEAGFEKDTEFDHPDRFDMLCVGIGYAKGKVAVIGEVALRDPRVKGALGHLIRTKKWIAHNGKFDMAGLRRYAKGTLYFDTMLASYLLDERRGTNGLKYLAVEYLGAPQYDDEIKRYVSKGESYGVVPRDLLYKYNAYDVACTWDLYELYTRQLEEEGLREQHDFLVQASDMLMQCEIPGVKIDLEYLTYLTDHYLDRIKDLDKALSKWVDNPRSPKQVTEALLAMGVKVTTTNKEMLNLLIEKVNPEGQTFAFLDLMLQSRKETKLYGTYVKGVRKRLHAGHVHPTFLIHGTTTGRLSCRNPNLQNVPRDSVIKRMYIPEDGCVFVQGDYAQAELRVIATLAQDEYLRSVFNEGRDIHGEVAYRFFGAGWTKEQRVRAKAVVFGLAYGREAFSLAQEFKIPVREAQTYLDDFFSVIPDVVRWRESIKQRVLVDQDDLISPFGRHRRYWLITPDNQKDVLKEAYAFLPQATASDINLHAAIRLRRDHGLDVRILVHDSILVNCPEADATDVAALMANVMKQTAADTFSRYVPFEVDTAIGKNWGDLG